MGQGSGLGAFYLMFVPFVAIFTQQVKRVPSTIEGLVSYLDYMLLDVFTDKPFTGNPLAVVLYPEPALSTAAMQTIAQEFNLSETVFIYRPTDPMHSAALRIFTATFELPFAGHPTVGAAVALGILAQRQGAAPGHGAGLKLEETIGLVAADLSMLGDGRGRASFVVPKLPVHYDFPLMPADAAAFLGLSASALAADVRWGAAIYACGSPFLFITLRSKEDVDAAKLDVTRYARDAIHVGNSTRQPFVYPFHYDAMSSEPLYARMLSMEGNLAEDPATGSAAAALAGYLFDRAPFAQGSRSWHIHQGVAMGRPSTLELGIEAAQSRLSKVSVAGKAVLVGEGKILSP